MDGLAGLRVACGWRGLFVAGLAGLASFWVVSSFTANVIEYSKNSV